MVRTGGATLPKRNWQSYQSVAGTEADAKEDEVVHLNFKGKRELRTSESQILAQLVEDDDSPDALAALQLRVKRAAVCIVNALKGHGSGVHPNAMDLRHYRSMRVFHNSRPIRIANAALFMGICFMERPSWCYDRECLHELGGQVPMWPLPLLAVGTTVCLETVCLLIWAAEVYLMYDYGGFSEFGAEHAQLPVRVGLLTIASCDAVWTAFDPGHFRVGMYLRPLIVVAFSAKLQHSFANIARVLPKVANVALLLLFQLLLFGCVGTLLFQDFPESALFFKNFHDAYLNLFVLLSTANNPRVMVPAYHHSRPSCLFFVSFLCLGFFFLMNLLLATIFGNYKVVVHYTFCAHAPHSIHPHPIVNPYQQCTCTVLHHLHHITVPQAFVQTDQLARLLFRRGALAEAFQLLSGDAANAECTTTVQHCKALVVAVRTYHGLPLACFAGPKGGCFMRELSRLGACSGGRVNEAAFVYFWSQHQAFHRAPLPPHLMIQDNNLRANQMGAAADAATESRRLVNGVDIMSRDEDGGAEVTARLHHHGVRLSSYSGFAVCYPACTARDDSHHRT